MKLWFVVPSNMYDECYVIRAETPLRAIELANKFADWRENSTKWNEPIELNIEGDERILTEHTTYIGDKE